MEKSCSMGFNEMQEPYYLSDISVTSLQVSSCGSSVSLLELEAMEIANVFIQYTALISFSIPFP